MVKYKLHDTAIYKHWEYELCAVRAYFTQMYKIIVHKKKKKTELVLTLRIRYIDFSLPALNVQNLKFTNSMACHGSILLDPSWCSLIPES